MKSLASIIENVLVPIGFTPEETGLWTVKGYGVVKSVRVIASSIDDSKYMEAFVELDENIRKKIPALKEEDVLIGGRVSPSAVDYLDYSIAKDLADMEVIAMLETVIIPWFQCFSNVAELLKVFEAGDYLCIVEEEKWLTDIIKGDPYIDSHHPVFPSGFIESQPKFVEYMTQLGYECKDEYDFIVFFRKKDNFWEVLLFTFCSYGAHLLVRASHWLPQIQNMDIDSVVDTPASHEDLMLINGGYVSVDAVDKLPASAISISDITVLEEMDKKLRRVVDVAERQFFSEYQSVKDYIDSIYDEYKKTSYLECVIKALR